MLKLPKPVLSWIPSIIVMIAKVDLRSADPCQVLLIIIDKFFDDMVINDNIDER